MEKTPREKGSFKLPLREDGSVERSLLENTLSIILSQKEGGKALAEYIKSLEKELKAGNRRKEAREIFSIMAEICENSGIDKLPLTPDFMSFMLKEDSEKKTGRSERRPDLDKKKKQIFNASIKVFSRKGYHGATMEEIAAAAAMGKGSIYRYFKSKEDLLRQLLSAKYAEILDRFVLIFERDENVLLQIQEMIEIWIEFIEENHLVYNLIQNKNIQQLLGQEIMFYDFFVTHLPMLKDRIIVMNRENKLKTTSFYTVIYGILGFIDGVVQKWQRSNRDYPLSSEIPVILEVLFNGFVGEKNTGKSFIEGK